MPTSIDHDVLADGYDTDAGPDCWKVKNSWKSSGKGGYVSKASQITCQCGISSAASYLVVNGVTCRHGLV